MASSDNTAVPDVGDAESGGREGISEKTKHHNPMALNSIIVSRTINGLKYNIEVTVLLSGQTIMIRSEDEFFKEFKETWRGSTLIDNLNKVKPALALERDTDITTDEFLMIVAENVNFITSKRDRRKRRMSFHKEHDHSPSPSASSSPGQSRPSSADTRKNRTRSSLGEHVEQPTGRIVRRFVAQDDVEDDVMNVLSFDEIASEGGTVPVEKDRYVAIGGPSVESKSNCMAFTVLASQVLRPHMVLLHEKKALGKTELEHYPRCAVCKKGPGWHLTNEHENDINPAIIRNSDRRTSIVKKESIFKDMLIPHLEELSAESLVYAAGTGGAGMENNETGRDRNDSIILDDDDHEDVFPSDDSDYDLEATEYYKGSLRERTRRQIARNRRRKSPSPPPGDDGILDKHGALEADEKVVVAAKIGLLEAEKVQLQRIIDEQQANPKNVVPTEFVTKLNQAKNEVTMLKQEMAAKAEAHQKSEQSLREQLLQVQRAAQSRELHFGNQLEDMKTRLSGLNTSVQLEQEKNAVLTSKQSLLLEQILEQKQNQQAANSEALTKQLQETIRAERENRENLERAHRLEMEQAKEELKKAKRQLRYDHEKQIRALQMAERQLKDEAESSKGLPKPEKTSAEEKTTRRKEKFLKKGVDSHGIDELEKSDKQRLTELRRQEEERHAGHTAAIMAMQERMRIVDEQHHVMAAEIKEKNRKMKAKARSHAQTSTLMSTFGDWEESPGKIAGRSSSNGRPLSAAPSSRKPRPQSAAPSRSLRTKRPQSALTNKTPSGSVLHIRPKGRLPTGVSSSGMDYLHKTLKSDNRPVLSSEIQNLREFVIHQSPLPQELQQALQQSAGNPLFSERPILSAPKFNRSPLDDGNGGPRSPRGTPLGLPPGMNSKKPIGYHRLVAVADHYAGRFFLRKPGEAILPGTTSPDKSRKKNARPQTAPLKREWGKKGEKNGGYSTKPPWEIDANTVKRPYRIPHMKRISSAPRTRDAKAARVTVGISRMSKRRQREMGKRNQGTMTTSKNSLRPRRSKSPSSAVKDATTLQQKRMEWKRGKMKVDDYQYNPITFQKSKKSSLRQLVKKPNKPSSSKGLSLKIKDFQKYLDSTYNYE